MQFNRINKDNLDVREALLRAYNRQCFYLKEPLTWAELEIDHIIPEKLGDDRNKLSNLLKRLKLPDTFELNSFYNLVPTKRVPNRSKGGDVLPDETLLFYLYKAKEKVPKIEQELKRIKEEGKKDKIALKIDKFFDELPNYEPQSKIDEKTCTFADKHVRLFAYLPSYPKLQGSCLITFKALKLRDCMITFSHNEIMSCLFRGLKTELDFKHRGFFVSQLENNYFVQLGNNRFALSLEEISELCWVIDELSKHYISRLENIENVMEVQYFDKSKNFDEGFRLIQIRRSLWVLLLCFAREFQSSKGNTKWHVFDQNTNFLQVYGEFNSSHISPGYHAVLYPERIEDVSFSSFQYDDNDLWVVWKPVNFPWQSKLENYSFEKIWSAKRTFDWLVNELIPYACYYYSNKGGFKSILKRRSYQKFLRTFEIENYYYPNDRHKKLDLRNLSSKEDCLKIAYQLQIHFTIVEQVYLRADEVKPLYQLLISYLRLNPLENFDGGYGYVINKISNENARNVSELINELVRYLDYIPDGDQNPCLLDHAFRGLIEIMKHGNIEFDTKRIQEFSDSIMPLLKSKEQYDKMQRMQEY